MEIEQINQIFKIQQQNKFNLKNTNANQRIRKLQAVKKAILELRDEITDAMIEDFGKSKTESDLTEILPVITMINLYSQKLKKWMRPKGVKSSMLFLGTKNYVSYEAKGNCLIISPWNYPFQLAMYPLLTAFSAGNTVILKPSEFTPHTNKIIRKIIDQVFNENEVCMIEGEVKTSEELLSLPFDHIFFTGSTPVGKIIMEKASRHLASVALELGGKSPVIIDSRFPMEQAAKNIAWGKLVNAGQTCVAPDYILLPKGKTQEFVKEFKSAVDNMYPSGIEHNGDYCRIITPRHANRLKSLIDSALANGAKLEMGGELFENNKIPPTLISGISLSMDIMQEEIFGPILPIIEYSSVEEAVQLINKYDNSLALYVFSFSNEVVKYVRAHTNSGGYSVNETLLHVGHSNLPFGGAGKSGLGKYHGHFGFEEMSNMRSVLHRKFKWITEFFYPPYSPLKQNLTQKLLNFFNRLL